jgi:DNA polymerase III epsilon subunit-like protein
MYKIKDQWAQIRWMDVPILYFDFETTSLLEDEDDPESLDEQDVKDWMARNEACHVVQVAADLYHKGELIASVYDYVKPSIPEFYDIPPEASAIHGITRPMIEGDDIKTFEQVWEVFGELITMCGCCVAYNGLGFDKKVLELEFARMTGNFRKFNVPLLDPMIWNKMKNKKGKSRNSVKLIDAAKDRGCAHARRVIQGHEKAHNAKVDIDMLREVTVAMSVSDIHTWTLQDTIEKQTEYRAQLLASSVNEKKKRKAAAVKKKARNDAKKAT